MISVPFISVLKCLLFSPIYGVMGYFAIRDSFKIFHVSIVKFKKVKIWAIFTAFFLSILVVYKGKWVDSPISELLMWFGCSIVLGIFWAWLFLEFIEAIGKKIYNLRRFHLWSLFAGIAFVLFVLCK